MCGNMRLSNILSSLTDILDSYDVFSYRHIYRENNKEANKASKEGLLLMLVQWKINEEVDGAAHEYYHRPFIERVAQI